MRKADEPAGNSDDRLTLQALLYAGGGLGDGEAAAFERRLGEDQRAREALCQAVQLAAAMRSTPAPRPGPGYRAGVRRRLSRRRLRRRLVVGVVVCAAAAVILLAAVLAFALVRPGDHTHVVAEAPLPVLMVAEDAEPIQIVLASPVQPPPEPRRADARVAAARPAPPVKAASKPPAAGKFAPVHAAPSRGKGPAPVPKPCLAQKPCKAPVCR